MSKLQSFEELKALQAKLRGDREARNGACLAVGMATCGIAAGAKEVARALEAAIAGSGLKDVSVISVGCMGFCYAEPLVEVRLPGQEAVIYGKVNSELAGRIVAEHVVQNKIIEDAVLHGEGQ